MSISNFKPAVLGSIRAAVNNDLGDTFELRGIGGHDCRVCISVDGTAGRYPPIGFPAASDIERIPPYSAAAGTSNIKRQHVDFGEQVLDGLEQSFQAALRASVAQFGRDNDARADVVFARVHNLPCCSPCGFLINSEMMFVSSM